MSDKCLFYLTQGLTPSARKVYASAQRCFVDFCAQDNSLSPSGSALPASEHVLIHFCCHPAYTLHHSFIKVYLSAIQSLHIEEGLPSLLVGFLRLQCVLRRIKGHQGSNRGQRQPISYINIVADDVHRFSTSHSMKLNPAKFKEMIINFMAYHDRILV